MAVIGGRKFNPRKGLGLGLGLGPRNRTALVGAAKAGGLDTYLADKPELRALIQSKVTGTPTTGRGNRQKARALSFTWGGGYTPGLPSTAPTPVNVATPGVETSDVGGEGGGGPFLSPEDMIRGAGGNLGARSQGILDYIQSQQSRLGNAPPPPTFEDMFSRWLGIARGEAERQAAQVTEDLGFTGQRYGSGLARMQGDYRKEFLDRVMSQADTVGRGLRQDRFNEDIGYLSARGQVAALEEQARQAALQRLFADSLATRGLPPALLEAIRATAGLTPDTIVSGG